MGGSKIKLDKELYERLKKAADVGGYSSVDEFVVHVLEKELAQIDDGASDSTPVTAATKSSDSRIDWTMCA